MTKSAIAAFAAVLAVPCLAAAQPQPGDTIIVVEPQTPLAAPPPVAPPSTVPPAAGQPAPQNERWSNVSHVNGTPVPVGTRNDYVYTFRRTIVASNPVGWMFGFYGLSVTVAVSDNVALRGDINVYDIEDTDGTEFGVGVPIYFRRTFQGPFLEPGAITRTFNRESGDDTVAGPQMLLGWHWTYESGLNLAVAAGVGRDMNNDDEFGDDQFFNGYLRVGYAF
jgi:hypothetical protein